MSNLPNGAFITSIEGKRCTAIPRNRRSAAPAEPSSSTSATTASQPEPTQGDGDNRSEEPERGPEPEPQPEPTEAPEETSISIPPGGDEILSSESLGEGGLVQTSENTSEVPTFPPVTSTSTSIPPNSSPTLVPEVGEDQEQEEDGPESQGPDEPSTSPEPIVPAITQEEEEPQDPEQLQGELQRVIGAGSTEAAPGQVPSPSSLLLDSTEDTTSSSVVISTATLLAGLTSLASPSTSSFFFTSTPSSSPDQTPVNLLPSSFTSSSQASPSSTEEANDVIEQASDSLEGGTDTTAFPDQLLTSTARGTITTIGFASSNAREQDGASETTVVVPSLSGTPQEQNGRDDTGLNPVLIGGIVGSVVGLALMALLLWCCIRRRAAKKVTSPGFSPRFSTRMSMPPGAEKRKTYEFDNGSVGPTPRREKFAAALGYHVKQFGGRFGLINGSTQTVDLNRGNSQFMQGLPSHSRQPSFASLDSSRDLSARERFLDWWSRLKADVNFNWRLRNGHTGNWAIRNMMEKDTGDYDPDFMALLNKDEKRALHRSVHSRDQSITSIDRFLGDLGMDLNNERGADPNPFSDSNAAVPARTMTHLEDPFTDAAAAVPTQRPPQTYVAAVRRSRGASISNGVRASNLSGELRNSVQSNTSFETRRNKCRSDPFDLELDTRKLPKLDDIGPMPTIDPIYGLPPRPNSFRKDNHVSGVSSRYTQASLGDWSDPGPDIGRPDTVGTTTTSWTSKPLEDSVHRSQGSRSSQNSKESDGIGKAV